MSVFSEFRTFALKGNVVDLAIGVVIGAAFGKIVSSLVDNVLMPPLGLLLGGMDFSHFRVVLQPALEGGRPEVAISYGLFIQAIVNFLIVAWAMFIVIKAMNRMHLGKHETPPAATPEDILLLREIRDSLKK